ncbi:MAG: dTDP-4-dehydrorhamnose 3,5-epimerase family protein [Acidobacteriia bacterium]|nr:dTDP-4-dehydrorhamnose 3,5-epimerase family protein [Terriglobia bacterium]
MPVDRSTAGQARSPGVAITIPTCEKGLGTVIRTPDSADLIQGVALRPYAIHPDDRGYFLEVARLCEGMVEQFPAATTQVSAALSYPGTIKAFHFHNHQTDFWVPVMGMLQVALVDLRAESPTFGRRNTIYAGTLQPLRILIPPGVGHGYKVIGTEAALLVYVTNRQYDPSDEGRIPYNDENIQYDWDIQHK